MKTYVWSRSLASALALVGALTWMMLQPRPTYACSCAPPGDPVVELERSAAVFEGTVIAAEEAQHVTVKPRRITFAVIHIWKGITAAQVVLATGNGGGDCGFEFEQGRDYVVYAYRTEPDSEYGEGLATSICSRTKPLDASAEDIMLLGQPTKPVASTSGVDAGVGAMATATPASITLPTTVVSLLGLVSLVALAGSVIIVLVRRRSSST